MKKANARLQKALQKFKDSQSRRFEPRRSVANAVITSVERDSVTGHTTGIVRATIDGIPDQNVFVGSGQGFSIGSVVRVENRGGSFSPDWTLIGRVGSVAGAEGTLDIDRTLSTPTGVVLSTDAYTPVAGAGIFSSVTVTFNQNQDYESVASYDIQWFKDSEGASTAQLISVPHVVGQATNLGVVGGLLPSSISVSQSYSFRVRAKAYSGAVGGWTEYASIETAADPTAPSTPTGLSAIAIDDYTLRLYWTANSEPDFSYYVLDVSATNSTSGRLTGYPRTVGNQNEFILGVSPNIPRYFAIKAVDATGNESDYSSFAGPFKTENLPSDAGLFYFGPTIELVAGLSNSALTMDVNFNILEAGWFVHLVAPNGTNEIVQINTSSPGGSTVSNGDGYRYNIVRAQGGTTAQTFAKGTVGHALTTAGYIQSDVREGVSNTPTIRMYEWDDPYTNVWADKTLRVALGNLGGITDPSLGALSGYGLYSDNVYLTGQIVAQGGAILGSIQIDGGSISSGGISIGDNGIIIDSDDGDWISWRDGSTFIGSVGANVSGTSHFLSIGAFNDTGSEAVSTRIEITAKQAESYVNILEDDLDVDFKGLRIGLVGGVPEEMLDVRGNAYIAGNILAATTGQDIGAPSARWDTLYVETVNANSITGSLDGLEVGVDIQAYDADLTAIAALAKTDGNFIVGNGSTWVAESGSTARTSLGLGSIATQAASSVAITGGSITGITDLAIADGGTGASTAANARTNLGLGTANSPTFAGLTINGNIGVTGTVDGVDVSAHKSRHESGGADAINHDSLTGFVANEHIDHTAVSITAGNGLTGGGTIASSRTLNVGAGNGISVAADSVAVNQAYDFTWTGLHTFDNHTEMDSVDINGALTVSDDLTVFYGGYSPLFVNVDTINPSNSNVGIMPQNLPGGVPDPQFALDVGGPLRAQYLIGPHAIQLSDAALIAHYDGPYPFETNFSGFAAGHLGQVATETGGVIYRPGKFGKAVQLAEATTNLITNPSFEVSTSGWSSSWGDTISRSTEQAKYGLYSLKIAADGSANGQGALRDTTVTAGQTYTISCWVYVPSSYTGASPSPRVYDGANFTTALGAVAITERDQWVYWSTTQTITSTTIRFLLYASANVAAGQAFYLDAVQIEQKAYATPYCLHPDSMVASERGIVRLDDIQIGDRLLGSNGFNSVEAKWDVYTDAYEITFKNGYSIVSSGDHRFLATKWPWDYNESSGWRFREVKELVPGDYVKLSQKENIDDGSDEPEMAYLLGYLIGDGYFCLSDSKGKPRIAWTFGVDYAYMADHVSAMYNKCMPPSPNGGVSKFPSHRKSSDREIMLTTHSSLVADTILAHGVKPDTGALGKSVPLCVWDYKKGDLLSFLAGLIDSDGSVDADGAIKIDSASEKLINDIRLLVSMRLGVHGHISAPRDTNNFSGKERVMYRIRFTKADSAHLFSLGLPVHHSTKRERLAQSHASKFRRKEWAQVASIKPIGRQRLIDITIEPDHDFVAEGLVTHNCDGSLGTGHTWAGTAHASTSSRTAASLTYATANNIDATVCTVMAWVYATNTAGYQTILRANGSSATYIILRYNAGGTQYQAFWGGNAITGGTAKFNQWVHLAATFDGSTVTLYENGVEVASGAAGTAFAGMPTVMHIGAQPAGGHNLNGYLDDLVILSRAADAAEIRAIYESNAPVFAESSIDVWRTPTQVPIWVDSEGLWMRAVGGGETLGAYGGDATKSWGGKTLYQSDFLLGNATDGYIHWHAFQDDSDPWGAAGMEVKAEMDIIGNSTVSGVLSVTGEFSVIDGTTKLFVTQDYLLAGNAAGVDETSFAVIFANGTMVGTDPMSPTYDAGDVLIGDELNTNILWDQSAGRMNFRNGTTVEAYVDDGTIFAGGGVVKLDSNGFSVQASTTYAQTRSLEFVNGSDVRIAGIYGTVASNDANIWVESFAEATGDAYAALVANSAADQLSEVTLSANDGTTSTQLIVRHPATGQREVEVTSLFRLAVISEPGSGVNPATGAWLFIDTGGDLKVKFANGTVKTIATN